MVRIASLMLAAALGVVSVAAIAAEDPILTRQKLMSAAGAAVYGAGARMMKEEIPFNPIVAAAVLRTADAVAYTAGDYFPEGSDMGADTRAAPAIWEEMEKFQAYFADLQKAADAAIEAEPKDLEAFKTAMAPVMDACNGCHDDFRVKN